MEPRPQSPIAHLLDAGWVAAGEQKHALSTIHGCQLGSATLLVLLGTKNRVGAVYFQIFLQDTQGRTSDKAVILGLHHSGPYPAYNWVEIVAYAPEVTFASEHWAESSALAIAADGLAQQLFGYLGNLLPPGGHIMVEYDSPEQEETAKSLELGMPIVVTPLGYLLYSIGCGASFKNWYFAEGGSEGPRKLQGYKALSREHARDKAKEMVRELKAFLGKAAGSRYPELEEAARSRASRILRDLEQENSTLGSE